MCAHGQVTWVPAEWLIGGPETVAHSEAELPKFSARECRAIQHSPTSGWAMNGCIPIDACLADEIIWLNGQGIKTFTCCCGHAHEYTPNRWISVHAGDNAGAAAMEALGYEHRWFRLQGRPPEPYDFLPRWS